MIGKKPPLGIIASSGSLITLAQQIALEQNEEVSVACKGLEAAVFSGREMEETGVEVIVSRGGTSHLLRENLSIPVLSIPMTSQDILRSIQKAATLGNKIVLTTFRSKLGGIDIFEKLFHIKVMQGVYHDTDSLENMLVSAQSQGFEVVIGGGISMRLCKQYGLHGVELETAKETVVSILEDAKNVAASKRLDQEKTQRYSCIIDAASDGIIAIDRNGVVTTMNRSAKKILQISDEDGTGKPVTHYLPNTKVMEVLDTQKAVFNNIENIHKNMYVSSHIPIELDNEIVGAVSTFRDIPNVMKAENEVRRTFAKGLVAKYHIDDIIYKSPLMKNIVHSAKKFAASDLTLLITGETGTGKEIVAQSIHNLGPRKKGPFVSINCAALPEQLLESELFGHEEGSFTGARRGGKPGLFEIAHNGTMFLDEIGSAPRSVQGRLLRVLQEKEVMRIGGDRLIPINTRVIAATNKDLFEEVQTQRMREDLFFRLNVLSIHIPPLRDRVEDIPLLAKELIRRTNKPAETSFQIPDPFIDKLMKYSWPGNIRQLENFLERLSLLSDFNFNSEIFDDLYQQTTCYPPGQRKIKKDPDLTLKQYMEIENRENEYNIVWDTLRRVNFSKTEAAKRLGISRTTLWRKLKNIDELS
jgi:PAS domain S-box-containing protein